MPFVLAFLMTQAFAADRFACGELLARPHLYGGNHVVRHWVTRRAPRPLALRTLPLSTLVLIVAAEEHRGILHVPGGRQGAELGRARESFLYDEGQSPWAHSGLAPARLDRAPYDWLTRQNPELIAWIRARLDFVGRLELWPTARGAVRYVEDEARRAGLPDEVVVIPFFDRALIEGEQLELL